MEDWRVELIIDKGPNARHFNLQLEPFTLIGATTRAGPDHAGPAQPLRHRLPPGFLSGRGTGHHRHPLGRASWASTSTSDGALEIARRSRGTPRAANRLLRRVRDFAQVDGQRRSSTARSPTRADPAGGGRAGAGAPGPALPQLIIEHFGGGPVGIQNMSVSLGEETDTLEDMVEPFLIQSGLLKRTAAGPRGHAPGPGPTWVWSRPGRGGRSGQGELL